MESIASLPYVSPKVADGFQRRRNILLAEPITKEFALRFMLVLKEMEFESESEPIWVIIDSLGGEVQAGWSIIDSMNLCKAPIRTVCYGEAASIAALVFVSGEKGGRYMLEHAKLMIHQPWSGLSGWPIKEADLSSMSDDLTSIRRDIESYLAQKTGVAEGEIHRKCESDYRMDALEAVRLGFADKILH